MIGSVDFNEGVEDLKPEMCENPDILNLHYLKRDSDKTE